MNVSPTCDDLLDEREPAKDWSHAPHLGDCLHETVFVMVPFLHGVGGFPMTCTLAIWRGEIQATTFPSNWRAIMSDHGYPTDSEAEKFLVALAWLEFVRRNSR